MIGDENTSIEEKMDRFDKLHNKTKFKAFGKVTINGNRKQVNESERSNTDDKDRAKELFEEQEKKAEYEIQEIKKKKLPKLRNIWEIRKKVLGGGKEIQATAVMDPETEKLVVSKERIKTVTLQYCQDTLSNNEPNISFGRP